jgi:phosphohistidine phosphatase SixA
LLSLLSERIHDPMIPNKILRQSYLKASIAALAIVTGCATGQQPSADPPAGREVTTVYLVRHAEKSTMVPTDPDPDLTDAGKRRAANLATRLGAAGVTGIIVTQFKRTRETAEPLATAIRVEPEMIPAGANGSADSVAAAVLRHRGGKVLVVGHSNTIAGIIVALGGPHLPNLCDTEYSNLFVMYIPTSGKVELTRQHYGASDPAPDKACQEMQAH